MIDTDPYKKLRITILIIVELLFIICCKIVHGAPIVVTAGSLNSSESLEIMHQIPEKYFKYVDVVEFVNESFYWNGRTVNGLCETHWGSDHACFDVWITVVNPNNRAQAFFTLWHELGHVYEYCELGLNVSSEEFADAYYSVENPEYC